VAPTGVDPVTSRFSVGPKPIRRNHDVPVSLYLAGIMSLMDRSRLIQIKDNCGQDVVKRIDLAGPQCLTTSGTLSILDIGHLMCQVIMLAWHKRYPSANSLRAGLARICFCGKGRST
jgi:hypothetical protein